MPPDAAPGWSYKVDRLDHTRQCALNVVQNCRGIPFAVRYSLTNTLDVYLVCRLKVEYASLGASDIAAFESRHRIQLPADYRETCNS